MAARGRPAASVVTVDGTWAAPTVRECIELTSSANDPATQLLDLARGLGSYLSGAAADRVVIRRADWSRARGNTDGPRQRLLAEGALAAGARAEVESVSVKTGKDLADLSPAANKEALDGYALALGGGHPEQALAAALVGLTM